MWKEKIGSAPSVKEHSLRLVRLGLAWLGVQRVKPLKLGIHEHTTYALHCSHVAHKQRTVNDFFANLRRAKDTRRIQFSQKTDKYWFVANGMRTIRRRRSAGSQSHPHIRAFGLRTVHERFANHSAHSCIRGFRLLVFSYQPWRCRCMAFVFQCIAVF